MPRRETSKAILEDGVVGLGAYGCIDETKHRLIGGTWSRLTPINTICQTALSTEKSGRK